MPPAKARLAATLHPNSVQALVPRWQASAPAQSAVPVTGVRLQPAAFTTAYQSVVAQGRARVAQGEERRQALLHICRKFAPGQQDRWEEEIAKFPNTTVVCVELTRVTGKQNGSQA